QTAAGAITAAGLGVNAAGDVLLCAVGGGGNPINDVDVFAATNTGANARVEFSDLDEVVIGTVAVPGVNPCKYVAASGVVTGKRDISSRPCNSVAALRPNALKLGDPVNAGPADVLIAAGSSFAAADRAVIFFFKQKTAYDIGQ